MKKLLCAVLLVSLMACCALAKGVKLGVLTELKLAEENTNSTFSDMWQWSILAEGHGEDDRYIFYDSLTTMLLALDKGEIDEIDIPEIVAEYLLNNTTDLKVSCVVNMTHPMGYAFGFLDGNDALRDKFDEALRTLEADGTLEALRAKYFIDPGKEAIDAVKFDTFNDAETIRVAVTGDLPPLDYVASDGEPAGFNTAVLAAIGRLLKLNIRTLNVEAGARAAALTSGRADTIFWMKVPTGPKMNDFVPKGIIFSRLYYKVDNYLQLRKR